MTQPTGYADCYSANERRIMEWTQRRRAMVLRPLLVWLSRLDIRPDAVTLLSLVAGLFFIPLFPRHPVWALIALAMHVVLDGIDGPLARFQSSASRRGSFTDTLADQCVLAGVAMSLVAEQRLDVWIGGTFLFAYTLVVVFAMVRNALDVPYRWLVRPRFVWYAAMAVETFAAITVLPVLTTVLTAFLLIKVVTGYLAIRRSL